MPTFIQAASQCQVALGTSKIYEGLICIAKNITKNTRGYLRF
ncbi:hypothetical protein HMPREF1139_1751 [Campylobacter sp. FOBRC14]|nr:hypothetical protein HMPREF1139_1751 [Campylobacter sp. FOBRC14]